MASGKKTGAARPRAQRPPRLVRAAAPGPVTESSEASLQSATVGPEGTAAALRPPSPLDSTNAQEDPHLDGNTATCVGVAPRAPNCVATRAGRRLSKPPPHRVRGRPVASHIQPRDPGRTAATPPHQAVGDGDGSRPPTPAAVGAASAASAEGTYRAILRQTVGWQGGEKPPLQFARKGAALSEAAVQARLRVSTANDACLRPTGIMQRTEKQDLVASPRVASVASSHGTSRWRTRWQRGVGPMSCSK